MFKLLKTEEFNNKKRSVCWNYIAIFILINLEKADGAALDNISQQELYSAIFDLI